MAIFHFPQAYSVRTSTTPAGKEQNTHDIDLSAPLGPVSITDTTGQTFFNGNDVVAIGLNIGGIDYFGWISRPVKVNGDPIAFYFWSDTDWNNPANTPEQNFALAQQDGNTDGDSNTADNIGFILVVYPSHPLFQGSGFTSVGSSSDKVDTQLNFLLQQPTAPIAYPDTTPNAVGTPGGAALEEGFGVATVNATGNVVTNDRDQNNDPLSVIGVSGSSQSAVVSVGTPGVVAGLYGTLTLQSSGDYTFVVNNAAAAVEALRTTSTTLTDTFSYTISDGNGGTSTTTLAVTIRGSNDAPVAMADANVAKEITTGPGAQPGIIATGNVLSNDTDVDAGDTKTVQAATLNGQYGTLVLNADGSYTYTPVTDDPTIGSGDSVDEVFNYTMQDAAGVTSSSTLTITVLGSSVSDPTAANDTAAVSEGLDGGATSVSAVAPGVLANDAGPDIVVTDVTGAAPGSVGSAVAGQYGTLTLQANGAYTYVVDNVNATVNGLNVGGSLQDVFQYQIRADNGTGGSALASLTLTISGVDDTPTAGDDVGTAQEAGGVNNVMAGTNPTGNAIANDVDPDDSASTLRVISVNGVGGNVGTSVPGNYGSLLLAADGSWTYTVAENSAAVNALPSGVTVTDIFTYVVAGRNGIGTSDTATITVTVQGAADLLDVSNPLVNEDSPFAIFTVSGAPGIAVALTLDTSGLQGGDTAATPVSDHGTALEYYDGAAWTAYNDVSVTMPDGGQLLVRTQVFDDNVYEGAELFTLRAATLSADATFATGNATILDNATGSIFLGTNTTGVPDSAGTDDDRPTLSIDSPNVAEGAMAVFTVSMNRASTKPVSFTPTVSAGTALPGTDTDAVLTGLQYRNQGSSDWFNVNGGSVTIAPSQTSIELRLQTTGDALDEINETFTLSTGSTTDPVSNPAGVTGTATILDDDTAGFTLGQITGNTTEAGGTATFTVTLDSQPTSNVVITVTSDDLSEGQVTSGGTLTFTTANWNIAQTVTLTGVDDTLNDGDIVYHANLSTASSDPTYGALPAAQVTVSNIDNDGPPTLTINDVSVSESAGTATFTVTRTGALGGTTTVDYATAGGTATSGTDFTANTNTLTFAAGETTKSIVVAITDDALSEPDEQFTVTLSGAADATSVDGVVVSDALGQGTILANDAAGVTVTAALGTTTEGGVTTTFTVRLDSEPTANVVVTLATNDATEGQVDAPLTLTFTSLNWNVPQTVTVRGVDDTLNDDDIAYTVTWTAASQDLGYQGRTGPVNITNLDDDGPPTLSIDDVSVSEGAGTATFTVTRTGALGGTTTVDFATAGGTATSGTDFTANTNTLTFAPGETTKTIVVAITDDALSEPNEQFTVTLSGAADATSVGGVVLADAQGIGTILANDAPGITLGQVTGGTTEAGGQASFTVTLNSQPTSDVTITVTSDDLTEGQVTGGGTLTFTPGNWNVAQTVTLTGVDDTIDDGDIVYHANLTVASSDLTYAALTAQATVTNLDNDGPPTLSIDDVSVSEGAGTATFTVTRTGALGGTTSVNFTTAGGTATSGADFTANAGTLAFAAGETTKTIVVAITDDALNEPNEQFTVTLSGAADASSVGGVVLADAQGIGTILANDTAGITLGQVTGSTTEAGGQASFTVVLNSQPTSNVVITVTSDDLSEGQVTGGGTLTFTPANWNIAQTVTLTGVDDTLDDGDIVYHANLTVASSDLTYAALTAQATVTNLDDDGPPTLSIDDVSVSEGAGTATFTVTRTGALGGTTSVNFATAGGTATSGADFTANAGTLTFAAGETTKTIVVAITDDALNEPNEQFTVTLSGAADASSVGGVVLADAQGIGTILANDTAGITLGQVTGSTTEAGGQASFTVVLNSQPTSDVTITVTSDDLTEGQVTGGGTLTFTPANWNIAQTVTLTGVDDTLDDGDIVYNANLTVASSDLTYAALTAQATVTNLDDDGPPALSIDDVSVSEAGGFATFTVTRTGATGGTTTVSWATQSGGTATPGLDFTAGAGVLSFAAGETSKTVTVAIAQDNIDELNEAFTVLLTGASDPTSVTGATITRALGTATILDDDTLGFTVGLASGNTSESGGTATFTFLLDSAPTSDVVITLGTNDGTEGVVVPPTTLTFTTANWNITQTVTVAGVDDPIDDGDIPYQGTWSSTSSDPLYDARTGAVGITNLDNDAPPTLTINDVTIDEASGTAVFTVTRSGALGGTTTVQYTTVGGTATSGADFTAASGTLVFDPGVITRTIAVAISNDQLVEGAEAFSVTLSGIVDDTSAAEAIADSSGTGTITDNDVFALTVTGTPDVSEGSNAIYTVDLGKAAGSARQFTLTLGTGSDTVEADDYSAQFTAYYFDGATKINLPVAQGGISLPAGVPTFYVSVATINDTVLEGPETLTLQAAMAGGPTASGISTILDDGTGQAHDDRALPVAGAGDDDRPTVTVTGGLDISEGSAVVYTVTLSNAADSATEVTLVLGAQGDTASASDYSATLTAAWYNGLVQNTLPIVGGKVQLPAGVTTFYVTANSTQDSVYEGPETLSLTASVPRNSSTGVSRIVDDGTGVFVDGRGQIVPGAPDNDLAGITITGRGDVSEGSAAIFDLQLTNPSASPTVIGLTLGIGTDTASSTDYAATFTAYYQAGQSVVALPVINGAITLPAGVTAFRVKVETTQDNVFESAERFTLVASLNNASASGASTILDDGNGQVRDDQGAPIAGTPDNDRPTIAVIGTVDVSEGTQAVFTVTLSNPVASGIEVRTVIGASGDTATAADYAATSAAYYYAGNVRTELVRVGDRVQLPAGVTSFYVSVATLNDRPPALEGRESFTLTATIVGGASASGAASIIDDGSGHVYDDRAVDTGARGDDDRFTADLDPASDNGASNTDRITSVIQPEFRLFAGMLQAGQQAQLLTPDGQLAGSATATSQHALDRVINVRTWQLDDGTYTFTARIVDTDGTVLAQAPVNVTVVTDLDGIATSIELAANNGDYNADGIADWSQNQVAHLPVMSLADFQLGKLAAASTFGAIMVGTVSAANPGGAVQLNTTAQLQDISIGALPAALPAGVAQASDTFNFSVTNQLGMQLSDMDAGRAGLQTRVVIDLPSGITANSYYKWDAAAGTWRAYLDDGNLDTFDDGATLIDRNGDGKVDRVVVTLTDGGTGDADHVINGVIRDPGMLVQVTPSAPPAGAPVYTVVLENGDRYYTTSAAEAAQKAQGTGNVFEGASFDSLAAAQGGRQLLANYNILTTDWYFAVAGAAMPYICYEAMPGTGFNGAVPGAAGLQNYHMFMTAGGQTLFITAAHAAQLNLGSQGYTDMGAMFSTTNNAAFNFDVEGYLVANQSNQAVRTLVQGLANSFTRTSDAGFVEAVEQHYLAQVQLTGISHGGAATAAELNAAFATTFGA